jgi:hypothetical protein
LDGRIAHVLLIELFTIAGVGTMISQDSENISSSNGGN